MADSRPPAVATNDAQLVLDEQLAQSTRARGSTAKAKTQAASGTPMTMNGPSPTASDAFSQTPTPPAVEVDAVIPSSTRGAGERSGLRFNYSRRPRGENGLPEYNAELPLFRVLFSWKGTILPLVLTRVSFWIMWGSHGVLILLVKAGAFNSDDDDDEPEDSFALTQPSWAAIGVPTSLTVFFLVSDRRLNV